MKVDMPLNKEAKLNQAIKPKVDQIKLNQVIKLRNRTRPNYMHIENILIMILILNKQWKDIYHPVLFKSTSSHSLSLIVVLFV